MHFIFALAVNANDARVSFKSRCLAFKPASYISNATLNRLEYVTAGTNLMFPGNDASCNRPSQVVNVDLCRVALFVPTSQRSGFNYELWLPETWNGRTLQSEMAVLMGVSRLELRAGRACLI